MHTPIHCSIQGIIHNIRNMKQLSDEQKIYIKTLSHEEKNKIILAYNDMIKYSLDLLNCFDNDESVKRK